MILQQNFATTIDVFGSSSNSYLPIVKNGGSAVTSASKWIRQGVGE